MATPSPLRWGMISTAAIGAEFIPGFRRSPTSELVAVASRDSERAATYADKHEIPKSFGSYDALLADESIDAVYISLPNALHAEWTRAALEAGKHVLCEKPLTPTAAEADELFSLARQSGLVLTEAFMYRHHPKTLRARELIQDGAIGSLRTIRCSFNFRAADPENDIRYSTALAGGALRDVGSYCVSYSTFATNEDPEQVVGVARLAASGVDERFYGTLAFPSGVVSQFDCALDIPLSVGVTLTGSDGEIHVPMPWYPHRDPLAIYLKRGEELTEVATPGDNAYLLEIEDLAAAARGEQEPRISASETTRNLRVIESLRASAGLT